MRAEESARLCRSAVATRVNDVRADLGYAIRFRRAEVANGDIVTTNIFQFVETMLAQIPRQLGGIEMAEPGFADGGRHRRQDRYIRASLRRIILERFRVVEHDLGAGQACDELEDRRNRFALQIRQQKNAGWSA